MTVPWALSSFALRGAGAAGMVPGNVTTGQIARSVANKLNSWAQPEDFGADGGADDTAEWQDCVADAMRTGKPLSLKPGRTYTVSATAGLVDSRSVAIDPCDVLMIDGNGATIKLADGSIVNSIADYDQHVPLLDLRGPRRLAVRDLIIDQNRAGQTYPATASSVKPGTGANPFRDNGSVRITARSSTVAAGRLLFKGCWFINAYLSGLACVEPEHLTVEDCEFIDCTWNGLTFASARYIKASGNYFYRCGTYATVYPPDNFIRVSDSLPTGDRAGIQGRCRPNDWTENGQGYPVLSTLYPNGTVRISKNRIVKPAVEGVYCRAVLDLSYEDNYIEDVGEGVGATHVFNPGAMWAEWIMNGKIARNTLVLTQARTLPPDGIRPTPMEGAGDSTGAQIDDPVPFEGNGFIECTDNIITVDRGFPAGAEAQWWRYGYYPSSLQRISGGRVTHCSGPAVYAINRGVWVADRIHDLEVHDLAVEYCKRIAEVTQYSGGLSPSGTVLARFSRIKFRRMYDAGVDSDDQALFVTPSTWLSVAVDLSIDGLSGDCTNAAGGTNFRAGLFRGSNASNFDFPHVKISNYNAGFRVYNFATCLGRNWLMSSGSWMLEYLASTGNANSGRLSLANIAGSTLAAEAIKLTPGTLTLDMLELDAVHNLDGDAVLLGYDATYHLERRATRCKGSDLGFRTVAVPFTNLRQDAAMVTVLPTAAGGTAGTAPGTPGSFGWAGTSAATVLGKATSSNAVSNTLGYFWDIPPDYVPGTNITAKIRCKISVVRQTSATIDMTAQVSSDSQALGSDICATAAQSCNSTTSTVFSFTVTGAGLTPGQRLFVIVTGAADDTGSGGSGTFQLHWLGMTYSSTL